MQSNALAHKKIKLMRGDFPWTFLQWSRFSIGVFVCLFLCLTKKSKPILRPGGRQVSVYCHHNITQCLFAYNYYNLSVVMQINQKKENICQTANFVLFNLFVMSGLCRTKKDFVGSGTGWYFENKKSKCMWVNLLLMKTKWILAVWTKRTLDIHWF